MNIYLIIVDILRFIYTVYERYRLKKESRELFAVQINWI